jgi:hypothetical protein
MDLELIMSLIIELQDNQFRKLFESKHKKIAKIDESHLTEWLFYNTKFMVALAVLICSIYPNCYLG